MEHPHLRESEVKHPRIAGVDRAMHELLPDDVDAGHNVDVPDAKKTAGSRAGVFRAAELVGAELACSAACLRKPRPVNHKPIVPADALREGRTPRNEVVMYAVGSRWSHERRNGVAVQCLQTKPHGSRNDFQRRTVGHDGVSFRIASESGDAGVPAEQRLGLTGSATGRRRFRRAAARSLTL